VKRETQTAVAILAASVLAVAGLAFYVWQNQRPPTGKDGCLIGQTVPSGHTVVLIDQTDKLDEDQLQYVRVLILREYMKLGIYDRFSVVGLAAADRESPPAAASLQGQQSIERKLPSFSRCRVQAGTEADWTVQNPEQVARKFQQLVGNDLAKVVGDLNNVQPAPTSPILETIDRLVRSVTFGSPQIHRRLVIVSDMAQHMPGGTSHYPPSGSRFAYSGGAPLSAGDLSGMTVRVHYVVRPELKAIQNADHRFYWQDYFKKSGASDFQIGWGLGPDTGDDSLSPIRDIASIDVPGPMFEKVRPPTIMVEPALTGNANGSTRSAGVSKITSPSPPSVVRSPIYSVEPYSPQSSIKVTSVGVNIRKWPFANPTTPILTKAKENEILSVVGLSRQSDGFWYQIKLSDGREAFVRSDLTSSKTPPPNILDPQSRSGVQANAAPPPSAAPIRTMPRLVGASTAEYPASARRRNEEGTVTMSLCVNRFGDVTDVLVLKSSGSGRLDEASRAWVLKQKFQPAAENGLGVDQCGYQISQEWKLK
jgi:TonB family protein